MKHQQRPALPSVMDPVGVQNPIAALGEDQSAAENPQISMVIPVPSKSTKENLK